MGQLTDDQYIDRIIALRHYPGVAISLEKALAVAHTPTGAYVTCRIYVPDQPEYVDEDGMVVDLGAEAEAEYNPFTHQSGPSGCPPSCAACGWDAAYGPEAEEEPHA